jgi:hypothetical protein
MKPDVRPVVSKLCVPVLATTVELLIETPLPRGTQPSVPPSSKSAESVPVNAEATCSTSPPELGALSAEQPTPTTPSHTEAKVNERIDFTMSLSLSNFRAVMQRNQSVWWRTVRAWLRLFDRPS